MSPSAFRAVTTAHPSLMRLKIKLVWGVALLLTFFGTLGSLQAQTPPIYYMNSAYCANSASPCGSGGWVGQPEETIQFAGFPGCNVKIAYDMRICPDGTVELFLRTMELDGPCGPVYAAIASNPSFLADRWREAFEEIARRVADNQASADPDFRCPPHGIKTKTVRTFTASCSRNDNSVIEIGDVMMPVLDTTCASGAIWCCPPNSICPPSLPPTISGVIWPAAIPTPGTVLGFLPYSYFTNIVSVGPGCWSYDVCSVKQRKDINGNPMWTSVVVRIPTVVRTQCGETCCKEEIAFCWDHNIRQETITVTPPAHPDPCYAPCTPQCGEPLARPGSGSENPKGVY